METNFDIQHGTGTKKKNNNNNNNKEEERKKKARQMKRSQFLARFELTSSIRDCTGTKNNNHKEKKTKKN